VVRRTAAGVFIAVIAEITMMMGSLIHARSCYAGAVSGSAKKIVIPGRRAAANPGSMNTAFGNMGSGFAAVGGAPE
jgi:hypothetical protein